MVTEAALVDYEKEERMNQPGIVGYIVKTEMICGAWQRNIRPQKKAFCLIMNYYQKN